MQQIDYREWRSFLEQDKSAVLIGLPECEPCDIFKGVLSTISPTEAPGWRFAWCHVPRELAKPFSETEGFSFYPAFFTRTTADYGRKMSGLMFDAEELRPRLVRMILSKPPEAPRHRDLQHDGPARGPST